MNDLVTQSPPQQVTAPGSFNQAEQQRAIAEVQAAMMIAKMNPRDVLAARDRILMSCQRPTLAESAMYNYPRGGQAVEGPSIRLAEAMAQGWGNMQFGIRELEQRQGESVVQAFAWDVENNTRREMTFTVKHERHTRRGVTKLTDPRDIYEMAANQGARRLRACILGVIPGDIQEDAVKQCQLTLQSSADTSDEGKKNMLAKFAEIGIDSEAIEARLQRRIESIQPAHIIDLRKIYNSIRDGMSKPGDWFDMDTRSDAAKALDKVGSDDKPADKPGKVKPKPKAKPPADERPVRTYAEVMDAIIKAESPDALDAAELLIADVADESQRNELQAQVNKLRK